MATAPSNGEVLERWVEPTTGMEFVLVSPGEFSMGSPRDEPQREAQERLHTVRVTQPFYSGRFEVTQAQWQAVLGDNPSRFSGCANCPVETVSYLDIGPFIARLEEISGERFRLPTEAEWEYACRAGSQTTFSNGDELTTDEANFDGRTAYGSSPPGGYRGRTTSVGSFAPNAWGVYDMHGNVWEWTSDTHCPYVEGLVQDPVPTCSSKLKVIRGGSWYFGGDSARCALRYTHRAQDDGPSLGLRLARQTGESPGDGG